MEWQDQGIVLSARKHGESAVIVQLLTAQHGRHAGLVRGGAGRRARGVFQPGNRVVATWRARLSEHLGNYSCELTRSHAASLMSSPGRLGALASASALTELCLPEREPYRSRVIADFIAGMSDRFAIRACAEIYGERPLGLVNV